MINFAVAVAFVQYPWFVVPEVGIATCQTNCNGMSLEEIVDSLFAWWPIEVMPATDVVFCCSWYRFTRLICSVEKRLTISRISLKRIDSEEGKIFHRFIDPASLATTIAIVSLTAISQVLGRQ
jgi:hypothetical protein